MVQLRLTNFKTGIKPNPRSGFNLQSLTPFQKMQLTYCRIWGTSIGDNIRSGKNNRFKLHQFKKVIRLSKNNQINLINMRIGEPSLEITCLGWMIMKMRMKEKLLM